MNDRPEKPLHHTESFSDEDYEDYISSKFEASNKPSNDILRAKVWKRLKKRLSNTRTKPYKIIGTLVSSLLICFYISINDGPSDEFVKKNSISSPKLEISWAESPNEKLKVSIKLISEKPAYIALVKKKNGGHSLFNTEKHVQINTADDFHALIPLEKGQELCVLGAHTNDELNSLLTNIHDIWASIPSELCSKK